MARSRQTLAVDKAEALLPLFGFASGPGAQRGVKRSGRCHTENANEPGRGRSGALLDRQDTEPATEPSPQPTSSTFKATPRKACFAPGSDEITVAPRSSTATSSCQPGRTGTRGSALRSSGQGFRARQELGRAARVLEEWRVGERRRGDHLTAGHSLSSGGVGIVEAKCNPTFPKERGRGQSRATASQWTHGALRRGASHWMRTGLIRHGMLVTTTIRWG